VEVKRIPGMCKSILEKSDFQIFSSPLVKGKHIVDGNIRERQENIRERQEKFLLTTRRRFQCTLLYILGEGGPGFRTLYRR
jgi:hypothetical protein